jgi:hypothetical protein
MRVVGDFLEASEESAAEREAIAESEASVLVQVSNGKGA